MSFLSLSLPFPRNLEIKYKNLHQICEKHNRILSLFFFLMYTVKSKYIHVDGIQDRSWMGFVLVMWVTWFCISYLRPEVATPQNWESRLGPCLSPIRSFETAMSVYLEWDWRTCSLLNCNWHWSSGLETGMRYYHNNFDM